MKENIRNPAVAGTFYPEDKEELEGMIKGFLKNIEPQKQERLRGLIVPHAGYIYSGEVAAYAYTLLREDQPKKILLLGPSHFVYLYDIVTDLNNSWKTPLGEVKISANDFPKSAEAHAKEHSLEVQIPFLQMILKNFEILPLVAGDADPRLVSKKVIKQLDDFFLIISSDLSHFNDYRKAKELDNNTIKAVEKLDYDLMLHEGDACGKIPILISIDIANKLNWKCRLLCKKNSGDISGDKQNVVGYASFAFYE